MFWCSLALIRAVSTEYIPESVMPSTAVYPFSLVLVGVALMLLVIFRPQGILGNKKELAFHA